MKKPKRLATFRLPQKTLKIIRDLAHILELSQAQVVEMAVSAFEEANNNQR